MRYDFSCIKLQFSLQWTPKVHESISFYGSSPACTFLSKAQVYQPPLLFTYVTANIFLKILLQSCIAKYISDEHLRKFTKKYVKAVTENARKEIDPLEIELKHLEANLTLIRIGGGVNFTPPNVGFP